MSLAELTTRAYINHQGVTVSMIKCHCDPVYSDLASCMTIELGWFTANNSNFAIQSKSRALTFIPQKCSQKFQYQLVLPTEHYRSQFPRLFSHHIQQIPSGELKYIFCHQCSPNGLTLNHYQQGDLDRWVALRCTSRPHLGSSSCQKQEYRSLSAQTKFSAAATLSLFQPGLMGLGKWLAWSSSSPEWTLLLKLFCYHLMTLQMKPAFASLFCEQECQNLR